MPVNGSVAKCSFCNWKEAHTSPQEARKAFLDHMKRRHQTPNDFDKEFLPRLRIKVPDDTDS